MFVISDVGDALVNLDNTFALVPSAGDQNGNHALLAWADGMNVILAAGPLERVEEAMKAIADATHLRGGLRPTRLDLRNRLGPRPDLTVARAQLVVPDRVVGG
jgi:hypothetical protein